MKHRIYSLFVLGVIWLPDAPAHAVEPPVPFPPLEQFAALWERSIFTTRDLPSPDAPAGPIFTDSLSLSGIYEVDGQVVAVIVDRSTTQFSEARIGSENESGIKIRKVQPGATMDKTRVQLQKGDQAGWIAFSETPAAPEPAQAPALQTRPVIPAGLKPVLVPPLSAPAPQPLPAPAPSGQPGDVPLPPP